MCFSYRKTPYPRVRRNRCLPLLLPLWYLVLLLYHPFTTVGSSPSLLSVSDDKIHDYVHSFLTSFLSQPGSIGISPAPFSAPAVVPDMASLLRGAAAGVGANLPMMGWPTEPPGVVPPGMDQPPPPMCMCMQYLRIGLG